jgi:rubrerythrin
MNQRTRQNLITAMKTEAFAQAKYARFAARARMEEEWDAARIFQRAADSDRTEHFAREAEIADLCASTEENLKTAIDEQSKQAVMYKRFADEAAEDGESSAAAIFAHVQLYTEGDRAELESSLHRLQSSRECKVASSRH